MCISSKLMLLLSLSSTLHALPSLLHALPSLLQYWSWDPSNQPLLCQLTPSEAPGTDCKAGAGRRDQPFLSASSGLSIRSWLWIALETPLPSGNSSSFPEHRPNAVCNSPRISNINFTVHPFPRATSQLKPPFQGCGF